MISKEKATEIALNFIQKMEYEAGVELVILFEETIDFEVGWMFFYQSKKYADTRDESHMIGGNAPIIIDKINSSSHVTGTRMDDLFYIENYKLHREDISKFYDAIR